MLEKLAAILRAIGLDIAALREQEPILGEWDGDQLKTEADRVAHESLSNALAGLGLGIPVISEEDAGSQVRRRPDKYWLIDPIDGTRSYAEGFSGYVTQAALMDSGRPVLAAIFAPRLDEMFLAERGGGATLNGVRLSVRKQSARRVLIDNYPEHRGLISRAYRALGCTDYLECGSIGLKICRVADGSANIFFKNVILRDWDVAPAHLVIAEAGGSLSMLDGTAFRYEGSYEKPGLLAVDRKELGDAFITRCCRFLARERDETGGNPRVQRRSMLPHLDDSRETLISLSEDE